MRFSTGFLRMCEAIAAQNEPAIDARFLTLDAFLLTPHPIQRHRAKLERRWPPAADALNHRRSKKGEADACNRGSRRS
jgi:hypothetical protein